MRGPSLRDVLLMGALASPGWAASVPVQPEAPSVVALQPTPAGQPSTATLPRVRLGNDSRFVLAAHTPIALVTRKALAVGSGEREILEIDVPPAVAQGGGLLVTGRISIRAPNARADMAGLREGGRIVLTSTPVVVPFAGGTTPALARLEFPVPERARLKGGELTVVAYRLPPEPRQRVETAEVTVPGEARLAFGYGVDTPGWRAAAAPVAVRAIARRAGGESVLFERRIDPATDPRDRRWYDASVDLGALAGERVRFVFETEAMAVGAETDRPFGVVSSPVILRPPGGGGARPRSVILISLDTLRARSVSAYGAAHPTTPSLDRRLAGAGALVRSVVTPAPFTPPAHMSMLTGLEPCVHGVYDHRTVLAPERATLAEILRANGYRTAAFTEDAYVVAETGFARGFDTYVENRSEESSAPGFAVQTFDDAARWLTTHGDQPFFLFIHTYQVHDPYTPPRAYAAQFAAGETDLDRYEEEIRYLDDVLSDFLDVLETARLAGDTIVVVTADHGEAFGEHGVAGHGPDLHDEALLVPLVVRAPGLVPAGTVVEAQVGLVDLAPTILALLEVAAPPMQGRSFAPLLTRQDETHRDQPVLSVAVSGDTGNPTRAVRTPQYKFIAERGGAEHLYDLRTDPLERNDLSGPQAPAAALAAMRAALAGAWDGCAAWTATHPASSTARALLVDQPGWLANRDELDRSLEEMRAAQAADPEHFKQTMEALSKMTPEERAALGRQKHVIEATPPAVPPPSDEVEDKLRSLGYLDE